MKKRRQKTIRFNNTWAGMDTSGYQMPKISYNGDKPYHKTSPSFHGFVPEGNEEQRNTSTLMRSSPIFTPKTSCENIVQPFDTEELLLNIKHSNKSNSIANKYETKQEERSRFGRYRQISESSSNTSMFSSPKSPIKMVFKKQSGSMTVVSPTFTSELTLSSKRKTKTLKHRTYEEPKTLSETRNTSQQIKSLVIEEKKPLRPIEGQTIINIGGYKYLVVPKSLEISQRHETTKLPFLLRPMMENMISEESTKPPTFELEETKSGQLILVPVDSEHQLHIPECMKRKVNKKSEDLVKTTDHYTNKGNQDFTCFMKNISNGYHAILLVFRFLSPLERGKCRRVCRLWKNIAEHPSLWQNVLLKNCHINHWDSFAQNIRRLHTKSLNMRGMLHVEPNKIRQDNITKMNNHTQTWTDFAKAAPYLTDLESIELPRIRISDLQKLMVELSRNKDSNLSEIIAMSIVTTIDDSGKKVSKENVFSLDIFADIKSLKSLKIKAASGSLQFLNLESNLKSLVANMCETLTNLTILSVGSGITSNHLDIISRLTNLESLEIGDCTRISTIPSMQPAIPLSKLAGLNKLVHLRIEGGKIGRDIGSFEMIKTFKSLELVNTQLELEIVEGLAQLRRINSLLMIPLYRGDAAAINAEILDSVLSMEELKLLIIGFTNEWLKSLRNSLGGQVDVSCRKAQKNSTDVFPIMINGCCEIFTLKKLYKTLRTALPKTEIKILKMPKSATYKQSVLSRK